MYGQQPSSGRGVSTLTIIVGVVVVAIVGWLVYNAIQSASGKPTLFGFGGSDDQAPEPVDGKVITTIPAAKVPLGEGSNYGLQFWMFIKDWDYRFGQEKIIMERVSSSTTDIVSPKISLHPTDNSLDITVSVFPSSDAAAAANPAPANSAAAGGNSYTCTVENVPLQSWFSVSMTVFQRNLDVYINGRLVKSCVLPGIPKPAVGDIVIGKGGGFSGSVCNLHSFARMLNPEDAKGFFSAGTSCGVPAMDSNEESPSLSLFGYKFRLSVLNKSGTEVRKYTF